MMMRPGIVLVAATGILLALALPGGDAGTTTPAGKVEAAAQAGSLVARVHPPCSLVPVKCSNVLSLVSTPWAAERADPLIVLDGIWLTLWAPTISGVESPAAGPLTPPPRV
jgi:hypothetical protein